MIFLKYNWNDILVNISKYKKSFHWAGKKVVPLKKVPYFINILGRKKIKKGKETKKETD